MASLERQPLLQAPGSSSPSLSKSDEQQQQEQEQEQEESECEEVFSSVSLREGDLNLRSLSWPAASVMLVKIQIGLGVLSLPEALKTLGLIPGIATLLIAGALITLANWTSGQFRNNHPTVHSVADVAGIVGGGRWSRDLAGVGYVMFGMMISGSAMLAVSIGLNTILRTSWPQLCTVELVAAAALGTGLLASYREVRQIAMLGWVGTASIFLAVLVLIFTTTKASRPPMAPPEGPFDKHIELWGSASLSHTILAILDITVAFSGTPMYFSVAAEMSNPLDYSKALFASQTTCTVFYLLTGLTVYLSCGQYLTSPALGSAGPVVARWLYLIALPGILVGAVVFTHLSAKYAFVKVLRGSRHLQESTPTHWLVWLTSVAASAGVAFLIAESIPFFSALLGLIGAWGASTFCFALPALCYFHERGRLSGAKSSSSKLSAMYLANVAILACGFLLFVGGTWASWTVIADHLRTRQLSQPFSCADNSI